MAQTPLKERVNVVMEMASEELQLDCFFMEEQNLVLVKITSDTYMNPVLAQW